MVGIIGMFSLFATHSFAQENRLPNILWITSEDNSPFLGCYGDKNATTPNLDQLAREFVAESHAG